ncbi:MAG: hypothetical protein FWD60_03565 [Candidatus Azobacteroides sp.]|nr:hypothetical protein [Candidatus Azobacteroides sp.]
MNIIRNKQNTYALKSPLGDLGVGILLVLFLWSCPVLAQTPQELKSYLPQISGWEIANDVEIFNPENLYERIDGAAPLFLENNFREMTSMEYDSGDVYIMIQAYRHATPEDAFGMYASERSPDLTFYETGGEAQGDDQNFYFFSGCMYVKMSASDSSGEIGTVMREIAKTLAEKIDPSAGYPAVFKDFPQEGKIPHTESYTTSNYIGHEFLKHVYTCNYEKAGKKFRIFKIDCSDKEGAQTVLDQYFKFTKQTEPFAEGEKLLIKDRYNGNIPCIWKGNYIIGIYSETGDDVENSDEILNAFI